MWMKGELKDYEPTRADIEMRERELVTDYDNSSYYKRNRDAGGDV